jgi:N-ethylmaleimide reductase
MIIIIKLTVDPPRSKRINMTTLFQPYDLGPITLANHIVMAPLTRNRAGTGLVPSELAATYYAQRATAGLLITEPRRSPHRRRAIRIRRVSIHRLKSMAGAK